MTRAVRKVSISAPDYGAREYQAATLAMENAGRDDAAIIAAFEGSVASQVGARFASAVSSASTGLELGLRALGVGPGDEVLVPAFTFPACANAVLAVGAQPVFVDIEFPSLNIDIECIEDSCSRRTRAVIAAHAFGWPLDTTKLSRVCQERGIFMIEDAACALGAHHEGVFSGTAGDIGVYSFHQRKIASTGEGGMVVSQDEDLINRISQLRSHGMRRGELYAEFHEAGHNYRISPIAAAIGSVQVTRIQEMIIARRNLAREYSSRLGGLESLDLASVREHPGRVFQSYVLGIGEGLNRDDVIRRMRVSGVETTLGTYGLPWQPSFRDIKQCGNFRNAKRAYDTTLAIPIHSRMSLEDVDFVCEALLDATHH